MTGMYRDALAHSANELRAMGYTIIAACAEMPLDEVTVEEFVGDTDPRDWLDKTGEEMTQMVEDILVEEYDMEHKERPSYSAQDMGVSLVMLALEYLE